MPRRVLREKRWCTSTGPAGGRPAARRHIEQEWGLAPEGYLQRRDAVITGLLATGPEWAEDLWNAQPVADRLGLCKERAETDPWPVTPDKDRPRWQCAPQEGVGPLRFGMTPQQVSSALDSEAPTESWGHHPFPAGAPWADQGTPDEWHISKEYYARAGVSAYYLYASQDRRGSALVQVSVHGRTGPQVLLDGIELIGRRPSPSGGPRWPRSVSAWSRYRPWPWPFVELRKPGWAEGR
ncbi:hypothetical protein ACFV1L_24460 [Kitasatospora sp. NPDC059646]|uniref:hypothetical protein n=1 Tax=Kitasatospora sp. NPDC059646 TaxID=3346893 RepID=UPI0036B6F15E